MVDRNSWKSVSHFHESTFVTSRVFFQEENGRLKRAAQREKTTKHEKTETVANLHGDISFIVAHTKFLSGRISHDVNKIRTYQTTWNSMQEMYERLNGLANEVSDYAIINNEREPVLFQM